MGGQTACMAFQCGSLADKGADLALPCSFLEALPLVATDRKLEVIGDSIGVGFTWQQLHFLSRWSSTGAKITL